MSKSKIEINLNRLLFKIESTISQDKSSDIWRTNYFIFNCETMLKEIMDNSEMKLLPDEIARYEMRIDRIKKLFEASHKENIFEEAKLIEQLPHGSEMSNSLISTVNEEVNIKRRFQNNEKMRDVLFQSKMKNPDRDDDKREETIDERLQDEVLSQNEQSTAKYTDTLLEICRQFKQQLVASSEIIQKDTRQVETDTELVLSNENKIKSVNTSLQIIIKTSWMWGNWVLVAIAFIIFFGMVIFMKIF